MSTIPYCSVVPHGFDSKRTAILRRRCQSDTIPSVVVTVFEYHNLWWWVLDIPLVVSLRSIGYLSKENLLLAVESEMRSLGFRFVGGWEVLRHE